MQSLPIVNILSRTVPAVNGLIALDSSLERCAFRECSLVPSTKLGDRWIYVCTPTLTLVEAISE